MLLSIVIPVYNVEKYIERCIRSCFDQDLNQNSYELVVIDDESPDNSVQIVEQFFGTFENIRIIRQKNKGLGGARNTGIQETKGDYILFLDSDDYLNPNVLKQITTTATSNQLDILDFGAQGVDETGKIVYTIQHLLTDKIYSGPEYFSHGYHQSACVRLYNRHFLTTNRLYFREKVYVEDVEFNFKAIFLSENIMATNSVVSSFVQTTGSITRSTNENKNRKLIYDILQSVFYIDEFSKKEIPESSIAYPKSREKVNEQVITLLKNLFSKSKDPKLFQDIIYQLKNKKLYPLRFQSKNRKRELFKAFANKQWIFTQCYKLRTF